MGYKGMIYFSDETIESEVFDSPEQAEDWCLDSMSCYRLGGQIMEANGEDACDEEPDYDVIEV